MNKTCQIESGFLTRIIFFQDAELIGGGEAPARLFFRDLWVWRQRFRLDKVAGR